MQLKNTFLFIGMSFCSFALADPSILFRTDDGSWNSTIYSLDLSGQRTKLGFLPDSTEVRYNPYDSNLYYNNISTNQFIYKAPLTDFSQGHTAIFGPNIGNPSFDRQYVTWHSGYNMTNGGGAYGYGIFNRNANQLSYWAPTPNGNVWGYQCFDAKANMWFTDNPVSGSATHLYKASFPSLNGLTDFGQVFGPSSGTLQAIDKTTGNLYFDVGSLPGLPYQSIGIVNSQGNVVGQFTGSLPHVGEILTMTAQREIAFIQYDSTTVDIVLAKMDGSDQRVLYTDSVNDGRSGYYLVGATSAVPGPDSAIALGFPAIMFLWKRARRTAACPR